MKTAKPAMMSGQEFHLRRKAIGLDLETFTKAMGVTVSLASKLQTGRSPVNRTVADYLQLVEDAVCDRVKEELKSLDHLTLAKIKCLDLLPEPPDDWPHGTGTWHIVITRIQQEVRQKIKICIPLRETKE